jgi:hypothetical protein
MWAPPLFAQRPTPAPADFPGTGEKNEEEEKIDRIEVQALLEAGLSPRRNMVRANTWSPLTVTLTNLGLGFKGNIEVDFLFSGIGDTDPRRYRRVYMPVSMPKKIKKEDPPVKRYSMPIFIEENDAEIRVRLEVRTGGWLGGTEAIELGRVPLSFPQAEDVHIVAVSDRPGDHTYYSELDNTPGVPVRRVVDTPPDRLPTVWNDYLGANAVVLDTRGLEEISGAALRALEEYVEAGGRLVVCGGDAHGLLRYPPWTDLLPVRVTGYAVLNGAGALDERFGDPETPLAGSLLVSTAVSGATGEVLLREGEIPLIARERRGLGTIYYVAFNLRDSALRSWPGRRSLARFLFDLDRVPVLGDGFRGGDEHNVEVSLLTNQLMDIPAPKLIGGFMLLYIMVTVPLNYLLLRWIRKPELLWISLPVLALAFSAGIYIYNQVTRIQRMNYSALTVLETELGSRRGRARSYWSIYSPSRADLSLELDRESALPSEPLARLRQNLELDAEVMEFEWDGGMRISHLPIRHQSNRLFASTGLLDLGGALEGELVYDGNVISGTVENRTAYDLHQLHFVGGGRGVNLGGLRAGETRTIRVRPGAKPDGDLRPIDPSTLRLSSPETGGGERGGALWVADMAWENGFPLLNGRPGFYLVGVSPGMPAALRGQKEMSPLSEATLVAARVPVRITPGRRVEVGGPSLRWVPQDFTTVVQEGGFPVTLGAGDWVSLVFEPVHFRLEDVRVANAVLFVRVEQRGYRRQYGGPYGWTEQPEGTEITKGPLAVEVFNRRTGEWDEVPVLSRRVSLQPLGDYVDPRFPRVRLRIMIRENASVDYEYIVQDADVTFTLEGGGGSPL